jgi:hypothetical protein
MMMLGERRDTSVQPGDAALVDEDQVDDEYPF